MRTLLDVLREARPWSLSRSTDHHRHCAELLAHLFGQEAANALAVELSWREQARQPAGRREGGRWTRQTEEGRAAAARTAEARRQNAEDHAHRLVALARATAAGSAERHGHIRALAQHLSGMTTAQLHALKRAYGVKASGLKRDLVEKLAKRLALTSAPGPRAHAESGLAPRRPAPYVALDIKLPAPKAPPPASGGEPKTPRQEAAKATKAALDEDYAFARKSAVPNAGEDILGSARHNRNAWRGLAEAEKEGTAAEQLTRDKLFKNEPLNLLAGVTEGNAVAALAAHLAMATFPGKPDDPKYARGDRQTSAEERRKEYYEAYQKLKGVAEQAAREEADPFKVLDRFHKAVEAEIHRLRGQQGTGRMAAVTAPRRYNAVANMLVDTLNRTKVWDNVRYYKKTDVGHRLGEFLALAKTAYGDAGKRYEPTGRGFTALLQDLPADRLVEHVKDVMEGDSFNKTFGAVKGKGGEFKPADLYVKHAEREGGRVIDADTVEAGTRFMLDNLGMRGLQYGNSVTDEERQHHLKMASEAFADLADVLGLPDAAVSMGGKLGLAIGARGKGTALAHYEPDLQVINLTRKSGVGSLAHEWGHFFDHELAGGKVVGTGEKRDAEYFSETAHRTNEFVKDERGAWQQRTVPQTPLRRAVQDWREALQTSGFEKRLGQELSRWLRDKKLSPAKANYWRSTREVFARTFERYVQHKLKAEGRSNTYLAGVGSATHWTRETMTTPGSEFWPTDAEVAALAPAFDRIFAAYRDSKGDTGEPAQMSRLRPVSLSRGWDESQHPRDQAGKFAKALHRAIKEYGSIDPGHAAEILHDRGVPEQHRGAVLGHLEEQGHLAKNAEGEYVRGRGPAQQPQQQGQRLTKLQVEGHVAYAVKQGLFGDRSRAAGHLEFNQRVGPRGLEIRDGTAPVAYVQQHPTHGLVVRDGQNYHGDKNALVVDPAWSPEELRYHAARFLKLPVPRALKERFGAGERRKPVSLSQGEGWATVGGRPEGKKKHVGGTPVHFGPDGQVDRGPARLKGRRLRKGGGAGPARPAPQPAPEGAAAAQASAAAPAQKPAEAPAKRPPAAPRQREALLSSVPDEHVEKALERSTFAAWDTGFMPAADLYHNLRRQLLPELAAGQFLGLMHYLRGQRGEDGRPLLELHILNEVRSLSPEDAAVTPVGREDRAGGRDTLGWVSVNPDNLPGLARAVKGWAQAGARETDRAGEPVGGKPAQLSRAALGDGLRLLDLLRQGPVLLSRGSPCHKHAAEILVHHFGREALDAHAVEMSWKDQPRHQKGTQEGGRWSKGGAEHQAERARKHRDHVEHAHRLVAAAKAHRQGSAERHAAIRELAGHLTQMTVAQLHGLKAEYGVRAGSGRKAELVEKLARRLALGGSRPGATGPVEAAAPWQGGAVDHGKVYNAPTGALKVDPARFQFKINVSGPAGVTDELKGIKTFNPDFAGVVSVWQDPADGQTYVVNGHHRHELAARTGHPQMAVRYIQAGSAKEARAVGALVNIAEGRGTAIDAAKFMRDMQVGPADMEKHGISLKGKVAGDAATLTRLNDRLFDRLARGVVDETKALAVARHLPDHDLQDQLFRLLDQREEEGKDLSPRVVEEMAREMAATPTVSRESGGDELFKWSAEESLFVERAELKAHVRSELTKEVNDFLAVASKRRAGRVAGAGNVLDTEANKKIAEESGRVRNVFDKLVNVKGLVSDAVNAGAAAYSKAKSKKEREHVREETFRSVRQAVFAEAGLEPGGEGKRPGGGGKAGAREPQAPAQEAGDAGRGKAEPAGLKGARDAAVGAGRAQTRRPRGHRGGGPGPDAGKKTPAPEGPPSAAGEPGKDARHPAARQVEEALTRYDNRADTARGGGLFGGDDLQGREGLARLPEGAPFVFTDGSLRGTTGSIMRDPGTGQVMGAVAGRPGLVPITPDNIEPLHAGHSWRTTAATGPVKQGGLFQTANYFDEARNKAWAGTSLSLGRDDGARLLDVLREGAAVDLARWVTVGGHPEGDRKHVGGFRVQIDEDGTILKGRAAGTKVSGLGEHFRGKNSGKKAPPRLDSVKTPAHNASGGAGSPSAPEPEEPKMTQQTFDGGNPEFYAATMKMSGVRAAAARRFAASGRVARGEPVVVKKSARYGGPPEPGAIVWQDDGPHMVLAPETMRREGDLFQRYVLVPVEPAAADAPAEAAWLRQQISSRVAGPDDERERATFEAETERLRSRLIELGR